MILLKSASADKNLFKGKYRISSARLRRYDYGREGAYLVTICTKEMKQIFGKVVERKMCLSKMGKIADHFWSSIPQQFSFAKLGEWVVMPNHMHGVLVIDKRNRSTHGDAINRVSTIKQFAPIRKSGGVTKDDNPMLHQNLATVVRWYKGRTTFEIHKFNSNTIWQPRFHEHIIRNGSELNRISDYIMTNPANWKQDRYFL